MIETAIREVLSEVFAEHRPQLLEDLRNIIRAELETRLGDKPEHQEPVRVFMTTKEAAEVLGVCERTICRRIRAGEIPAVRCGRLVRIPADAVGLSGGKD